MKKKKEEADERARKSRERWEREMAEIKEVVDELALVTKMAITQPDGTRFYVFDIPVRPEYLERKKGWEILMVKCRDTEERDYDKAAKLRASMTKEEWEKMTDEDYMQRCMTKRVEVDTTYTNGSRRSFSSRSTLRMDNDEEAIWEAIRERYFDAW